MQTVPDGRVSRGSHGCNRVYLYGEARKQGETRQKTAIGTCFSGVETQPERVRPESYFRFRSGQLSVKRIKNLQLITDVWSQAKIKLPQGAILRLLDDRSLSTQQGAQRVNQGESS